MQLSGSGLVAPCGMFFNEKYKRYHMGSLLEKTFKEIWQSEKYWDIMREICSKQFDAKTDCGTLCLQHKTNEVLNHIMGGDKLIHNPIGVQPNHLNFI